MRAHRTWAARARPNDDLVLKVIDDLYRRVDSERLLHVQRVNPEGAQAQVFRLVDSVTQDLGLVLSAEDLAAVKREALSEVVGYGPIDALLHDPDITEVMVNGPWQVEVERNGLLQQTPITFRDEAHLLQILQRMVDPAGRSINLSHPVVNAHLPDGSRLNAVIAPIALAGPYLTIRKFRQQVFTLDELIDSRALTRDAAAYLICCVRARLNIVVSGGTGTGKTTL